MYELICPNCGKVFKVDESSYASILKQVRDKEFDREVERQEKYAVERATARVEAAKNREIASLESELAKAKSDTALALARKDGEITRLNAQIRLEKSLSENARNEAIRDKEGEIIRLQNELEMEQSRSQLKEKSLKEAHDAELKRKDEEIAYYKDFKARQSTKMVGESLEQHCEIEFNKLRPTAFQNAYFEKDNDARTGSKGDFIYRESSPDGTEFISIMFEMKNEMDETATKHKNEDFFKELDKDRREKKCEYAVLVSLLEADNELYNNGIVDVSYRYEKMYGLSSLSRLSRSCAMLL